MLNFLDDFFTVFHLAFIGFVLFGWVATKTRRLHSLAILMTLFAWLMIGLYKGVIGYCPLTDLHWEIKRAMGETSMPSSFVEYIAEKVSGHNLNKRLVDTVTAFGLVFAVCMSAYFNLKTFPVKKKHKETAQ